ncbi:MAG: CPBP family intramembrane metalloprotease [Desulfobacterales bacterium]|nr:CPBP family intramembrane metalloprotease [Desulfobacterales bacterium]
MKKNTAFIVIMITAVALFVPLFITRGLNGFDFWWWMSFNLIILIAVSAILDQSLKSDFTNDLSRDLLKKIILGISSALFLYFVFFFGNIFSRILFPFAGTDISKVYQFKGDASSLRIALLMLFIIGPGEEIFWRGFIQRRFQFHFGGLRGLICATALYSAVHVGSANPMLILAAMICGFFWGVLYLRYRSMVLNITSHVLWDVAVFLVFPFSV